MKASPEEQKTLLKIQDLDMRGQQLAHTLKTLPQNKALADIAPSVESVKQRHIAKLGEVEDARAEQKRIEADVTVVETRMNRDADRLQVTSSMKDVSALESEIEALKKRRNDLEDIQLVVMQKVDDREKELTELDSERSELGERVSSLSEEKETEAARIEKEKTAVYADRGAIASTLPEDLIALYDRQRERYGIGAARLLRGVSLGSNVKLTGSDLATIRQTADDDVVICPDSGCILIRDEESGL